MIFKKFLLCTGLFFLLVSVFPQKAETGVLHGKVVDKTTKEALFNVVVAVKEKQLWFLTDQNGNFELKNIPLGEQTIVFQRLGLVTELVSVFIRKGSNPDLLVEMQFESLSLDEVIVVAK